MQPLPPSRPFLDRFFGTYGRHRFVVIQGSLPGREESEVVSPGTNGGRYTEIAPELEIPGGWCC
jgi:hypothetical protein